MDSWVIIVNRRQKNRSSTPDKDKRSFSFFEISKTDSGDLHSGSYGIVTFNISPRVKLQGCDTKYSPTTAEVKNE